MTFCCFVGQVCQLQIRDFNAHIHSTKTIESVIEIRKAVDIAIILMFETFLYISIMFIVYTKSLLSNI